MRSPWIKALFHPLNLMMLAASVVAALVSAWWLLPIGLLLWVIMVIAVARDPSLRIDHEMQSRAPMAQRFQRYFDRIERSQVSVFNSLASASTRMRKALQPIQEQMDTLIGEVYTLCQRMTKLENYRVVSQSQSDLEADLQQINAMIESTSDPVLRREYEQSRQSLQERLGKIEAVSTQLDRVEAQLLSLANEMDGVVTEIIRLQAMNPSDVGEFVPALTQRLREETSELKVFQREIVEI